MVAEEVNRRPKEEKKSDAAVGAENSLTLGAANAARPADLQRHSEVPASEVRSAADSVITSCV